MLIQCISHVFPAAWSVFKQTCFAKMLTVERCGLQIGRPRYPEQVEHEVALFLGRITEGNALEGCLYIGGTA